LGEGLAGRVALARTPVLVPDTPAIATNAPFLRERLTSLIGTPLRASGRLVGVIHAGTVDAREFNEEDVLLLQLIADRVAHAIDRARILDAERAARAEAELANRAKMEFLAMMSHELRTPLNAIAGYAELLAIGLRGPLTEAQRADVEAIHRNERHLLSLIEEVLTFAKLDAGRIRLEPEDVRVSAALASITDLIAPHRGLRLCPHACGPPPGPVRWLSSYVAVARLSRCSVPPSQTSHPHVEYPQHICRARGGPCRRRRDMPHETRLAGTSDTCSAAI